MLYLINALVFLITFLLFLLYRRDDESTKYFFYISIGLVLYNAIFYTLVNLHMPASEINDIARVAFLCPMIMLHAQMELSLYFPRRIAIPRLTKIFPILTLIFGIVSLVPGAILVSTKPVAGNLVSVYGPWYKPYGLYVVTLFISCAWFLIQQVRQSQGVYYLQALYVLASFILAGVIIITTNLLLPMIGIFSYNRLGPWLGSLAYIVMLAIAIFRHRLIGLTTLFRKSIVYVVLTALVTMLYLGLIFVIGSSFGRPTPLQMGISFFIISLVFVPIRDFILQTVDRLFYQQERRYRTLLSTMLTQLTNVSSRKMLYRRIEEFLLKALQVQDYILAEKEEGQKKFKITKCYHCAKNIQQITLPPLSTLPALYFLRQDLVAKQQSLAVLEKNGFRLLIVLRLGAQIVGAVIIKEKKNNVWYSDDELEILKSFAQYASLALSTIHRMELLQQKQIQLFQSEKLAAVGQTVAGLVHELKNPLTGIKLGLSNIRMMLDRKQVMDGEMDSILKQSEDNIGAFHAHLKNFLAFSKKEELHMEQAALNTLIQKAAFFVMEKIEKKKISFIFSEAHEFDVLCDPQKIQQVFLNLFLNAIDSMSSQGELRVSIDQTKKYVTVNVSDTGKGLSEKELKKIFEPFYTTKQKGTGMGLSVSKEIIQLHKGKIEVRSTVGKGTTVSVFLPAATA